MCHMADHYGLNTRRAWRLAKPARSTSHYRRINSPRTELPVHMGSWRTRASAMIYSIDPLRSAAPDLG